MTELITASHVTAHRAGWKWLLVLGVLLLVLGVAGVSVATLLELTSVLVFGPLLLASGIIQLLNALGGETRKDRFLHLIAAGLDAVLGFFIIMNPLERVVSLIVLIAIFLIVGGLLRLASSLATESRGRVWTLMTGVIALLLGISVWIGGPGAKLSFVGLCIAVDFVCQGVSWSALALAERKPVQTPVS